MNHVPTICVEIIGHQAALETFCRRHGEMMQDKLIVYNDLQRWQVGRRLGAAEISASAALENQ